MTLPRVAVFSNKRKKSFSGKLILRGRAIGQIRHVERRNVFMTKRFLLTIKSFKHPYQRLEKEFYSVASLL